MINSWYSTCLVRRLALKRPASVRISFPQSIPSSAASTLYLQTNELNPGGFLVPVTRINFSFRSRSNEKRRLRHHVVQASVTPSSPPAAANAPATAPGAPAADKAPETTQPGAAHPPANPPSVGTQDAHAATHATSAPHAETPALNRSSAATHPPATNASSTPVAPAPSSETSKKAPIAPPELPPILSCYSKKKSNGIQNHHCVKALDKVVYAPKQTLDKFSSVILANYKTCNIQIYKPKNETLTKVQVTSMVHNTNEACHSTGGVLFKTAKVVIKVEHGNAENTYELGNSVCQKPECPLTQGDCLSAFYQIPFSHKSNSGTSFSRITSGNCTVTVSSTDDSNFDVARADVYPNMKKLFNDCGRHPGKIYIPGGAVGFNGDLKISTRPSNRELCA